MDASITHLVNFSFSWFIVVLAIAGYFLTLKRMGEKWVFWIVLATGWTFFAIVQTMLISGVSPTAPYITAIWLSSYVLVIASLVILFAKLTRLKQINGAKHNQ